MVENSDLGTDRMAAIFAAVVRDKRMRPVIDGIIDGRREAFFNVAATEFIKCFGFGLHMMTDIRDLGFSGIDKENIFK